MDAKAESNIKVNRAKVQEEESLSIQDFLGMFLPRWKWFVGSVIACMVIAVLYLMITPPTYTRSAQLLIKDEDKAGMSTNIMNQMQDMGFLANKSNINNELLTLKSPSLMAQVVQELRLNDKYVARKGLRKIDLYKETPVFVSWMNPTYDENISFKIHLNYDRNEAELTDFVKNKEEFDGKVKVTLGDTVSTPVGELTVFSSGVVNEEWIIEDLTYTRSHLQNVVDAYGKIFTAALAEKQATIIDLTVTDPSTQKAADLINTIINKYNENWIDDKNKIAEATSKFINLRLDVIKEELTGIDNNIANFKGEHLLPDIKEVSKIYLEQSSDNIKQILSLQSQLSTVEYMQEVLTRQDFESPLPTSSALSNASLQRQVSDYNSNLLARNKLLSNSSESNPLVVDMTKTLKAMQVAILQSVHNEIASLNMQIKTLKDQEQVNIGHIARSPGQAKYLLSEERQQKVMEGLYLFLLQKREENELSKAFTAYNSRVITDVNGSLAPTSPKKLIILLVAFLLGFVIPGGIIYLREMMNTKVRNRKDIENLIVPFAGEVPYYTNTKEPDKTGTYLVVKEKSRNIINESFRVLRTNVDFMLGHDGKKVLMFTSLNPGSGKSFISANLSFCMSLKQKKVVAVDLDLRRASLSQVVGKPELGVVNYLNGEVKSWRDVRQYVEGGGNLDVIPVGIIPPNPTELLFNGTYLADIIADLRKEYDYVFLDCPPVDVVADAGIIADYADMTLFVIRAGLMEKEVLPTIDALYEEKKYPTMSVILNATKFSGSKYGKYGYGYGYGGYASDEDKA